MGGGNNGSNSSLPMDQSPVSSQQQQPSYQDPGHLAVIFAAAAAAKRASTAQHICRICGKNYINEGSLRKHMNTHPKTTQMSSNLRMWPCTVCQAVFTQESGLLNHMDHMRMDPKHQFFSRAVQSANRQTGGLLDAASPVLRLQIPGASSQSADQTSSGNQGASGDENNNLMLHQQQLLSNMDAYNHFREQMQCGQSAMGNSGGMGIGGGGGGNGGGGMNEPDNKHCVDENNLMAHQLNINLQNAAAGLNSTLSQAFQQQLGGVGGGGGGMGNDKDDRGLLMKEETSDSVHAAVVVNLAAAMRIQQHQLNCSGIL